MRKEKQLNWCHLRQEFSNIILFNVLETKMIFVIGNQCNNNFLLTFIYFFNAPSFSSLFRQFFFQFFHRNYIFRSNNIKFSVE